MSLPAAGQVFEVVLFPCEENESPVKWLERTGRNELADKKTLSLPEL